MSVAPGPYGSQTQTGTPATLQLDRHADVSMQGGVTLAADRPVYFTSFIF